MTDRELLELAAKAAGLRFIKPLPTYGGHGRLGRDWNPLSDDGDALRLAVMLGINIIIALGCVRVRCGGVEIFERFSFTDDAGFTATRRAIVRAAAEIGKATP